MENIIEIYDPLMCCPGGLCGPTIDPALLSISEALLRIKKETGFDVPRHLLQQHGQKFMQNAEVLQLMQDRGTDVLPITTVNGAVVKQGSYPGYEELLAFIGGNTESVKVPETEKRG